MSEPTDSGRRRGFGGSLRGLGDSMLSLVETRLAILSVEWAEERSNLVRLLMAVFISLWCLHLAVVVGLVYLLLAASAEHRVTVMGIAALVLLLIAAGTALGLRAWLKRRKPMFSTTINELRKDRDWLRERL
jgi:uncharacterized membrane protein YqjE